MKLLLLTANEFTKIFKRRGLMFFFVLVILNCFLAGLNVYESYTTAGGNFSLETELDTYRKSAITYKNQLLEYESELPSADESAVSGSSSADASETRSTDYKTYNELRFALMEAETYAAVYEKALELNILSRDDWRYSVLYDIINGEMKIACYRVILEAEPDDEDYISTVICPYLEISSNYTITEITTKLHNQTQNIETLWSGVEALDYGSYCKNQITTLQYDQAAKQSELEAINRQLEDNPSSIELAMSKRKAEGVKARVISMPSFELFEAQSDEYKESVMPANVRARVAVEAAATFGWHKYVGLDGAVIGLDRFGASAPYKLLFQEFGFTAENVAATAKKVIG